MGYAMVVLVVTLQNRLCQTRRPVALTVEIVGWLFCLAALCYGLLSPYLTIPVMKVFSLLIFCFKIGSAVYLLGDVYKRQTKERLRQKRIERGIEITSNALATFAMYDKVCSTNSSTASARRKSSQSTTSLWARYSNLLFTNLSVHHLL